MVNGISKKSLSVNHKVKIGNFLGRTSEMILEKLDDIIKERPERSRTNENTIKNHHRLLSNFHLSSLTPKKRRTSRKTKQIRIPVGKIFHAKRN